MKNFELKNGVKIPVIGLGTFPMTRLKVFIVTIYAVLKCGYMRIDTASAYGNEKWIGYALKVIFLFKKREELFITTKLSNREQENGNIEETLMKSMKRLGVNYIDLYLMHWPNPNTYINSWKKMEELYEKGLVKAIGVCNFHEHHFENLFKYSKITPMLNQIEVTPLLNQKKLIKFCNNNRIIVEAYSPLGRMHEKIKNNKILNGLAIKKKKTIPQIILRWDYQNGLCFSCKSETFIRLKENSNIFDFELSINEINEINENYRVRHNPDNCDYSKL